MMRHSSDNQTSVCCSLDVSCHLRTKSNLNSSMASKLSSAHHPAAYPAASGLLPSTFKLAFRGEIRRFAAPRAWADLQGHVQTLWGDHPFVFTYT
jgi:hypothetical protein